MLKLTLTTDSSGAAVEAHLSLIAQTLGITVEAVGLDGYVVALANPPGPPIAIPVPSFQVPTPNFVPPTPAPVMETTDATAVTN